MWVALFFIFIAVSVIHARYFAWTLARSVAALWPRTESILRRLRWGYMAVACSIPIFLLAFAIYFLLASPQEFSMPDGALLDVLVVYPFWLVTLWSFQCTLFVLPVGFLHWVARKLGVLTGARYQRYRHLFVVGVCGAFAVYVPVRVTLDNQSVVVRNYDYVKPGLPAELNGFKIALIADPQADRHVDAEALEKYSQAISNGHPDLVVVAGDVINRDPAYIDVAAKMLQGLSPKYGVFACIGDHDNFAYRDRDRSLREVRAGLARRGIPMLDNHVESLEVGTSKLGLILATHNYINRIDSETIASLFGGLDAFSVSVVCSHQTTEELLGAARRAGVDLFLSGHTHGGQVNFWLPFSDLVFSSFETPYVSGRYSFGPMQLIVSSGFGTSITPLRYRAPGTVDFITLRAAGEL